MSGAIQELAFPYRWEEFGDVSPTEISEIFTEILDEPVMIAPTGTIVPFVTENVPHGLLYCDGAIYQRDDYSALYALLDASYIVDADNFAVPDLRDRFLFGDGNLAVSDEGGEEQHALTIGEMPSHSHDYTTAVASVSTVVVPDEPSAVPAPSITAPEGGSQAHNNMPPYHVVKYGIVYV